MAHVKSFGNVLFKLFEERTYDLRKKIGLKVLGAPPIIDRKKINRRIEELQGLANTVLAKGLAKTEFENHVNQSQNYKITGRGWENKKQQFEEKFNRDLPGVTGLLYVFWNRKGEALYVGRTEGSSGRPASHFNKIWSPKASRITIYNVKAVSQLSKLECLAIHYFQPKHNTNVASIKKHAKACPLCEIHDFIESELRDIFYLR